MTTCAWLWIYAGSAMVLLELIVPGFVVCFFGLAAATVGVLKRVFVGSKVETGTDFDNESVGRIGRVVAAIEPPLPGRVLIGDAEWSAAADVPLAAGADVRVVAQDNLTMKVVPV